MVQKQNLINLNCKPTQIVVEPKRTTLNCVGKHISKTNNHIDLSLLSI